MLSDRASSRAARRILILVLPLLALRLLIPAGFMPVADAGGLAIGLCPGVTVPAAGTPAHDMHHMHHGAGHGGGQPAGEHHAPCLFAASSAPAFAPAALAGQLVLPARTLRTLPAQARTATISSIERAQSPRAPPSPVQIQL